jgi:hypothetical protein
MLTDDDLGELLTNLALTRQACDRFIRAGSIRPTVDVMQTLRNHAHQAALCRWPEAK